jgi:hypothetical protein
VLLCLQGGVCPNNRTGLVLGRGAACSNAENDGINVEMDPEDQFKVCIVIGWGWGWG